MSIVLIKELMIKNVHTIGPEEKIALARLKLLRHGIGALPIIDNDKKLLGILTLRDIEFVGSDVMNLPIKNLMTKDDLVTVTETMTLTQVADIMIKTGFQRIPVVDAEGRLVGLVTQSVVIRSFRALFK